MSYQYSKNNHLRWANRRFPTRGAVERLPGQFRDECLRAAREISKVYSGQQLFVFLSGGADSEVVAESFRLTGQPFSAVLVRYKGDINVCDISWAVLYCERNGIDYQFVDVDLLNLMSQPETFKAARRMQTAYLSHVAMAQAVTRIAKEKRGVSIVGSGEPEIQLSKDGHRVVQIESEYYLARHMEQRGLPGVPLFFEWSAELYTSFVLSTEIQRLLYWGVQFHRNSVPAKFELYLRSFGIEPRLKLGGFEKVQSIYPQIRKDLKRNYSAKYQLFDYSRFMEQFFNDESSQEYGRRGGRAESP